MKSQDIIMINSKEIKKLHIVKMHIEGKIKQKEAAEILSLTTRQVRRIAAKIKQDGNRAVVHKLRGKPSNNSKDKKLKDKIISTYREKYT
ncbi:MAG: helix-turn-helix domain-containing protein [Actinomycetota bacterium]|nr:helix-turn-helix domain-containing protein [Actinomycetota bacterium]